MFHSLIKPMEPHSFPHPFNSDTHAFQVKWDGVRILAFVNKDTVRLQNRKLKDRTAQYPEMQILKKMLKRRNAILDGEMISLEKGRPSFSRILQRDLATNPKRIQAATIPVTYMVFDLLYCDDTDLTMDAWTIRNNTLEKTLERSQLIQVTESFFENGEKFYETIINHGLEGIVAKEIDSPYLLGKKNSSWKKIKPRRDMNCVVGGYIQEDGRLKSLLIGAYKDHKLHYLGRVGSGLSQQEAQTLLKHFPALTREDTPFASTVPNFKNHCWLHPSLTAKVEFMEFTNDLQLRQPVIKGFTFVDPQECTL
ncbi:MAG: non-homologous end-joining DNA ligase [Desulfitobacteriaceae bacterium]|nr:non-homologous end-joining DNA ligase [Desulfitobacteriaceae bacterium]MDD4752455.1 non-homologous end-joining DNA ligase [Desulfitobacteriaceae bacterium]